MNLEPDARSPCGSALRFPPMPRLEDYRGTMRLQRRRIGRWCAAEFRLQVIAATVPTERTLKVTNWFGFDDARAQQFYRVAEFSPDWWTLVANVAAFMAAHRQNVIITPLMSLVDARVTGRGLDYDFTNFDRWVETFQHAGAIGYIEGSHLLDRAGSYSAGLMVPTFQIENGKAVRESLPPDDPRVEPFLTGFLTALNAHLDTKGWKSDLLPAHS